MRYNIKKINTKVTGLLELTNALTSELDRVTRHLSENNDNSELFVDRTGMGLVGKTNEYIDHRQEISEDEDDDDEDDKEDEEDEEDEEDDEDDKEDDKNDEIYNNIDELEELMTTEDVVIDKNALFNETSGIEIVNIKISENNSELDKLTVPVLKSMIIEKDPTYKLKNIKKTELVSIIEHLNK